MVLQGISSNFYQHGKNTGKTREKHGKNLAVSKMFCTFAPEFNKLSNMAQLELRLSSKIQKETGKCEVMLRFFNGSQFDIYSGSEIFVLPEYFEYNINLEKTKAAGVKIPGNITTATTSEAKRKGYLLRKSGNVVVRKRVETEDVKYHREAEKKIASLKAYLTDTYNASDKNAIGKDWLKDVVYHYNHPESLATTSRVRTFAELAEEYFTEPHRGRQVALSYDQQRAYKVLIRTIARYEGYVRNTDRSRKAFRWEIDKVTRKDVEDFSKYLKDEHTLAGAYPELFKRLFADFPVGVGKGRTVLQGRGENTVKNMLERLKSLFRYFYDKGYTSNRPFDGFKIGAENYGTPVYITIEERNRIADADLETIWEAMPKEERDKARMPIKTLIAQRDIFVFQCLVGCRVGDLCKLTANHIHDGVLVYTPHKTKDEGEEPMQARVPLHSKAQALIEKYQASDTKGRLFPCISPNKYNVALKVIFKMAGVTRMVEVRNAKTGENELRPINEIASSHLARRTFIGNAYFKVQDPNLIGRMSGHVEGSEAFKRYRKIEDSTLKDVIDLIG